MPRRKTPSAVYIQMHQLANERERLQEELKRLSDRTSEIQQRLHQLEVNLNKLEAEATQYNSLSESEPISLNNTPIQNHNYQSFVIEY